MKINDYNTSVMGYKNNQSFTIDSNENKEFSLENNVIEEKKESESTDVMNFATLCKKFPNISFVVVDSIDAIKQEYTGVCNTDAFGNLDKISIMIDEDVIKKLDNDYDNIELMIKFISDYYEHIKVNAMSSGCEYTAVTLHYTDTGELSYTQSLWFDVPILCREAGIKGNTSFNIDTNEKYLQTYLMNIQNEVFEKLFEIGENDQDNKFKSGSECAKKYQEHFMYQKEEIQYEN